VFAASKVLETPAEILGTEAGDRAVFERLREKKRTIGVLLADYFIRADAAETEIVIHYFASSARLSFVSYEKGKAFTLDVQLVLDRTGYIRAVHSQLRQRIVELDPDQITEPNKAPVPTAKSVTPAADAPVAPAAAAAQL
jgi:hypothetical protein